MAPTLIEREQAVDVSISPSPWSTNTFLAIGVASVLLLIAIGATIFFLRRRQSFQLGQRERDSVTRLSWSPVTTLSSTPFASQANSPMRPSPWEKRVLQYPGLAGGSYPGSVYGTLDVAPDSPSTLLKSRSALNLQVDLGDSKEETLKRSEGEGPEDDSDKRSISPIDLSLHLARLPSVKTGSTSRLSELVRDGILLGGTTFGQRRTHRKSMGPNLVDDSFGVSESDPHPSKSEYRVDALHGCAIFSGNEARDLLEETFGSLQPDEVVDTKGGAA